MNSISSVSVTLRVLLAVLVLALAGCANGDIDDPKASNAILSIEKIDPSFLAPSLTAIVGGSLTDLVTDVTVNSTLRTPGASYSDVTIDTVTVLYDPPLAGGATSSTTSVTLTVPAGGSLTITDVLVVSPPTLLSAGDVNTTTTATIFVQGKDLLGKPASATGQMTVQFLP